MEGHRGQVAVALLLVLLRPVGHRPVERAAQALALLQQPALEMAALLVRE
jgi:hypothetical protein